MLELFEIYKDFYLFDIQQNFIFLGLYVTVVFDIVLGHLKAWANNEIKSSISRKGIVSHGALLVALNVIYPIFSHVETTKVINSFMLLLTWSYLISVVENLKGLGMPLPKQIEDYIKNKNKDSE